MSDVLVTGGTGSFGQTIVRELLNRGVPSIRVLSRDEAKQDAMRDLFADDRIEFVTGDIRDLGTVETAMRGVGCVFHAAALKQVPNCERFPMEAIRTNALGSENVRLAALRCQPQSVVALSTDKACSPINAMGLSKALMERLLLQEKSDPSPTKFICVRYGNVVGSRGSVVPLFMERVRQGRPISITNPKMTRFLLNLPDAVTTALKAASHGAHGELWVRKMPAATVQDIAEAVAPGHPTEIIGARPGEKMHETLINEDEMRRSSDRGTHFVISKNGSPTELSEYTSENTERLNVEDLRKLLRQSEMIP